MKVCHKVMFFVSGAIALLSLSACNGIFGNIYDKPILKDKNEYGFIIIDDKTNTGRIYVDATDYGKWIYIDLLHKEVATLLTGEKAPATWDFAVHRYDTKTNSGAVMESAATDFGSIPNVNTIPEEAWVTDVWTTNKIAVDMSKMMDGIIVYTEDYYNPCLSKWLDVDYSTMPPIYTLSGKIYLLRLSNGTYAALRLANFMSDSAKKGFMTIDYLYPVQL